MVLGLGAIGLFWGNSDGLVVQVLGDVKEGPHGNVVYAKLVKGMTSWECSVCEACNGKQSMGMQCL
jgi:hypothetical protein